MKEITMTDFAHHIIGLATANNKVITNLQLQKVMYFTFEYMLKNNIMPNSLKENYYKNPFLVWRYGPVVESVYDEFSFFGANPILGNYDYNNNFFDQNVDKEIIKLLKENVFYLVNKSHQTPFWQENYEKINYGRSNIKYEIKDIE